MLLLLGMTDDLPSKSWHTNNQLSNQLESHATLTLSVIELLSNQVHNKRRGILL